MSLFEDKKFAEALECFKIAINTTGSKLTDLERKGDEQEQMKLLAANLAVYLNNRGMVYYELSKEEKEAEYLRRALDDFDEAIRRNQRRNAENFFHRGNVYVK